MLKQTIRNSIIGGLVFSLTVMIFGLSYAAWISLSTETDGQPLTAAKWNAVIDRLNSIDQKQLATAWVNFDGTSCTGGAGTNECFIRDSYNVSKVVRLNTGQFDVYFQTLMNNSNYNVMYNINAATDSWTTTQIGGAGYNLNNNTTSKFSVASLLNNVSAYRNCTLNNITVFGGK